jgi:hypothetical protein
LQALHHGRAYDLGSRSRDRWTIAIMNRREGLNGKDAPPEKDPIVTQFVTRGQPDLNTYSR